MLCLINNTKSRISFGGIGDKVVEFTLETGANYLPLTTQQLELLKKQKTFSYYLSKKQIVIKEMKQKKKVKKTKKANADGDNS